MPKDDMRALVFDVFGTVVDWRGSIIAEGEQLSRQWGVTTDWAKLADTWRGKYRPAMTQVAQGEIPWMNIDALHRRSLDELRPDFGLDGLDEDATDHLNRIWHRLRPWPDSIPGLTRLRTRFILGTLSNGNVALLVNMAKGAGLPWDVIFSAELVRAYKPDPATYLSAADFLGLRPDQVVMVAAHQRDLRSAAAHGLRTAFVTRPLEHGPDRTLDLTADPSFDFVATDFLDLAQQLGC